MLTPQPEIIYDIVPPIAVREINTDEVPIALIIGNPKSIVRMTIKKIPPPIPNNPEKNPTNKPVNIIVMKLKSNLALFSFLSFEIMFLIAMNNNKTPKIIYNILDGNMEATKPPQKLPIIPKIPSFIPGSMILSNF